MTPSEALDGLSKTFTTDRAYCDELFTSAHAEKVAEILAQIRGD